MSESICWFSSRTNTDHANCSDSVSEMISRTEQHSAQFTTEKIPQRIWKPRKKCHTLYFLGRFFSLLRKCESIWQRIAGQFSSKGTCLITFFLWPQTSDSFLCVFCLSILRLRAGSPQLDTVPSKSQACFSSLLSQFQESWSKNCSKILFCRCTKSWLIISESLKDINLTFKMSGDLQISETYAITCLIASVRMREPSKHSEALMNHKSKMKSGIMCLRAREKTLRPVKTRKLESFSGLMQQGFNLMVRHNDLGDFRWFLPNKTGHISRCWGP